MEMVFLPLVGVYVLVGVVEVLATEGFGLLEAVGGHGEIDIKDG